MTETLRIEIQVASEWLEGHDRDELVRVAADGALAALFEAVEPESDE